MINTYIKTVILICLFNLLVLYALGQKSTSVELSDFIYKPFRHEISLDGLKNSYRFFTNLKLEYTKNSYSKTKDTIFHYFVSASEFSFYHTKNKQIFLKATIKNRRVKLKNGIRIGISKRKLSQKLKTKIFNTKTNNVEYKTSDGFGKCIFKFRKNRLKEISIHFYPD